MHGTSPRRRVGWTVGLVAAALLFGGLGRSLVSAVDRGTYENLEAFTSVLAIVQKNYVEETATQELIEGAIDGMLSALDPHSAYLTPDSYKELQVDTEGTFGGLGIEITIRDDMLTVVSPIEDTPAYRAGVQAGDRIIKIEDELTKDMSLIDAVKKMRGKKGTRVTISLRREGVPRLIDVSIVREVIQIRSVKWKMLEEGYAYIRITQFQDRTSGDLERTLRQLAQDHGPLRGMVLDLRNNPGGLLSQAVKVSDLFLDSGLIVYTEGRLENQQQKYFARPGGDTETPMVVLINNGSASASEILAGAVQDHDRGVLLGTKTFGKGSVQTILPVEGGAALRLTTAMYFTPGGRSIQVTGIIPDIELENLPEAYVALRRRHSVREKNMPGHFDNAEEANADEVPAGAPDDAADAPPDGEEDPLADLPEIDVEEGELGKDPQLDRALEILKSPDAPRTTVAEAHA